MKLYLILFIIVNNYLHANLIQERGIGYAENKKEACKKAMIIAKDSALEKTGTIISKIDFLEHNSSIVNEDDIFSEHSSFVINESSIANIEVKEKVIITNYDKITGMIECNVLAKFNIVLKEIKGETTKSVGRDFKKNRHKAISLSKKDKKIPSDIEKYFPEYIVNRTFFEGNE